MVESFEEYSKNRNNVDLKDFKIKLSKNGFDKNLSVLLFLIQQEKDIKEKYGILSYLIKITYLNIDSLNNYNNEQKQIIKDLFNIFNILCISSFPCDGDNSSLHPHKESN